MPYVTNNMQQLNISEEEAKVLVNENLIYDAYKDDPEAEVPEGVAYYTRDEITHADPMDVVEDFVERYRNGEMDEPQPAPGR